MKKDKQKNSAVNRFEETAHLIKQQVATGDQLQVIMKGKDNKSGNKAKKDFYHLQEQLSDEYGKEYRTICKYLYSQNQNLAQVSEQMVQSKGFMRFVEQEI